MKYIFGRGTISFFEQKSVDWYTGIKYYRKKIEFKGSHKNLATHIQNNFESFAGVIHTAIKDKELKGIPVKLDYHTKQRVAENKARIELIIQQKKEAGVTAQENKVLKRINKEGEGFLTSFFNEHNMHFYPKDRRYESKTMQLLPHIREALAAGMPVDYTYVGRKQKRQEAYIARQKEQSEAS